MPSDVNYSSGSGYQSGKNTEHVAEGTLATDTNGDQAASVFDTSSRAFPFMICLVVINGIFAVGVLIALFIYLSRSGRQAPYVSTGAKSAPK